MTQSTVDEYPALQELRILMVDDDHDSCELIESFFTLYGADVAVSYSVQDALERFAALEPQLLLSDIGMPLQDGYVLIQAIRALSKEQGGQTPAIALTAFADKATQQQSLAAGFDCYVAKPIDPYELAEVVVRLLEACLLTDNASGSA